MWLSRLEKITTKEQISKLKQSKILIVGIGGVGGHALESTVRSGIENITIIDKDVVDVTNLNRQIISLNSNIGLKKVEVARSRILDINPNCNVKIYDMFLDSSNMDLIFSEDIDYVIDACDTITTKILLIKKCIEKNIKIISSMGTGNKFDPTKLKIIDITKTSYDPLAKEIRKKLKEENIKSKVMVVSSTEEYIKGNRIPGSNSIVPATAGILCASYVINDILN